MKQLLLLSLVLLSAQAWAQGPTYPYSVGFTWTLSTSQNVASQNIYRSAFTAGKCGASSKLNSSPLSATATTYTDQNPPEGLYCYFVTAVDAQNVESGPSNISQVAIGPPPPTNFAGVVAKDTTGGSDVIYAWTPAKTNVQSSRVYTSPDGKRWSALLDIHGPESKVRLFKVPSGTTWNAVTETSLNGESGLSNQVKVSVP